MGDAVAIVVQRFRDAALGLCAWEDALHTIGGETGAHMVQLAAVSPAAVLVINHTAGISTDQMAAYFDARGHDPAVNPRTRAILDAELLRCFTDSDVLGDTDRSRVPIYADLFHPADAHHSAQIRISRSAGLETGLTMMRSHRTGAYDRRPLELIELAAPGIADAVGAALALGTEQQRAIVTTAEALGGAAVMLGSDRTVVSLSPAAEALLREGKALTVRSGRLRAVELAGERALERAFRCADTTDASADLTLHARGGPLSLRLHPLHRGSRGSALSAARVLLTVEATPLHDIAHTCRAYGLTGAETDIAALIAAGRSLPQIAVERGRSANTVRTQLKTIFEKTGTHRQAELLLLLRQPG